MKSRQKKSNSPFGPGAQPGGGSGVQPQNSNGLSSPVEARRPTGPTEGASSPLWLTSSDPGDGWLVRPAAALSKLPGGLWLDPRKQSGSTRLSPARPPI